MDNHADAITYLESIISIYKCSGATNWTSFWEKYYSKRLSFQENDLNDFINGRCQEITQFLTELGQEHATTKKFLTELPLRLSKVILSWPPTTEQIKTLMSD